MTTKTKPDTEQESLFAAAADPVLGSKKEAIAIEVEKIAFDPQQPRRDGDAVDLSDILESVRIEGVLEPIRVRKHPNPSEGKEFMLVNGERRLRACIQVGRKAIRAFVAGTSEPDAVDEIHRLVHQLASNRHLEMNPVDEAAAIKRIHDAYPHLTMQQLATTVSRKKSTVMDRLALAEAPAPFQPLFTKNVIGASAAPIVKKYKDLPAVILEQVVGAVQEDFTWTRHIEKGEAVPNKDVEDTLHREVMQRLNPVDDALALFYNGQTVEIDKVIYAIDKDAYVDAVRAQTAAAAEKPADERKSAKSPTLSKVAAERSAPTETPSQRKAREKEERAAQDQAELAAHLEKASKAILDAIGIALNKAPAKAKSPVGDYLTKLISELGFHHEEAAKRVPAGANAEQLVRYLVMGALAADWRFAQNRGRFPAILKELGLKVDIRAIVAAVAKQSAPKAAAKMPAKPAGKNAAPKKGKR